MCIVAADPLARWEEHPPCPYPTHGAPPPPIHPGAPVLALFVACAICHVTQQEQVKGGLDSAGLSTEYDASEFDKTELRRRADFLGVTLTKVATLVPEGGVAQWHPAAATLPPHVHSKEDIDQFVDAVRELKVKADWCPETVRARSFLFPAEADESLKLKDTVPFDERDIFR
jgi:hypothetical protein